MDGLIKYEKAQKLKNFDLPKDCPYCNSPWRLEPPSAVLVQEGFFSSIRMAQLYAKTCEFCNKTYRYYK